MLQEAKLTKRELFLLWSATKAHEDKERFLEFISHIHLDHESLVKEAVELVTEISKKNPVAVAGIKHKPTHPKMEWNAWPEKPVVKVQSACSECWKTKRITSYLHNSIFVGLRKLLSPIQLISGLFSELKLLIFHLGYLNCLKPFWCVLFFLVCFT